MDGLPFRQRPAHLFSRDGAVWFGHRLASRASMARFEVSAVWTDFCSTTMFLYFMNPRRRILV